MSSICGGPQFQQNRKTSERQTPQLNPEEVGPSSFPFSIYYYPHIIPCSSYPHTMLACTHLALTELSLPVSRGLSLSVSLPLTDRSSLGRFIFILYDDRRVGASLTAAGCPVPTLGVAAGPTNIDRLSQWLKAIALAECACIAATLTLHITLVRASHVPCNSQQTCTASFILFIETLFCVVAAFYVLQVYLLYT